MEIGTSEIEPLPESLEVNLPVLGEAEGSAPETLVALGADSGAGFPALIDLDQRLELFLDVITTDASSVLDPGSMWTVQALDERGSEIEVAVGRRGDRETSFVLPSESRSALEVGSLLAAPSETLFQVKNILGTVKAQVEFRPDPATDPIETDIWLPVLRLHCPPQKGCEAEYAIAHAEGGAATFELSIFGIGGGGGQSMTCTVSQVYTAKAQCTEVAIPAKLLMQFGSTYVNDTQIAYGMRATIADVDPKRQKPRRLPPNHGCGLDHAEVDARALTHQDLTELDATQGNQTWEMKLENETEGKLSLGLELGSAPIKMGFDYVRKTSAETTITTGLSPGALYTAYPPPDGGGFEVMWTS